jgi:patatin-like phospholipase/acyl hydrolase
MAKYRILSIDGGGLFGVISIVLLQRLSNDPKLAGWLKSVDLVAGTSTGGLIAIGVAGERDMQELRDLYENKAAEVFSRVWWKQLIDWDNWIWAKYEADNLAQQLKATIGDQLTLGDLKKKVLITTFDLDNESQVASVPRTSKPKLFHNLDIPGNDGAQPVYKVGLYSCLAPTFWPSDDGYIDGGVCAPNPSMCALAQSQDQGLPNPPPLSEVVLLSIGASHPNYIEGMKLDWGKLKWAAHIIYLMLHGVCGIADYQCRQLLGDRYHRLAPDLMQGWADDDVSKIPDMVQFAESFDLSETIQWIQSRWL